MSLTPFPVSFRKAVETLLLHTVHLSEGMSEVHPFLRPIVLQQVIKTLTDAGEGLIPKSDQAVGGGSPLLGSKLKLAVQCF